MERHKDLSLLFLASQSFKGTVGDFPYGVTLPVMRYFGDPSDDAIILARPRAWLEVAPNVRIGAILKGSIVDGNLTEMHGPYLELPGFPDDECLLQVGIYNLPGNNSKLEVRLICTTN